MPRKKPDPDSEHTMPHVVDSDVLDASVLWRPKHEAQEIRGYVERQTQETVRHLEKMKTEYVFGNRYDAWDVHTNTDRYWVITAPTNLYSQKYFPSLDYTTTFHIGLSARISARERDGRSEERDRLLPAFRKWSQAAAALERADEAEDFQAVGMRCREALLELVHAARENARIAATPSASSLKAADFLGWAEVIADQIAAGRSAKERRGYLKTVARATWQLLSSLTHARNAFRADAQLALAAAEATLLAYASTLVRFEESPPERCPTCSSYRLIREPVPLRSGIARYVNVCEACGWTSGKTRKKDGRRRKGEAG